jgi:hypothetical protein
MIKGGWCGSSEEEEEGDWTRCDPSEEEEEWGWCDPNWETGSEIADEDG